LVATYYLIIVLIGGNRAVNILRKLLSDDSGATAIEYGLIAALIAIVLVGTLKTVGANLKNTFNTVATSL
jgi:pilus assembly protein Flp/PilA